MLLPHGSNMRREQSRISGPREIYTKQQMIHCDISTKSCTRNISCDLYLDIMSSRYPILQNRPIDQWKVTELKEELKRRKLTTRGLKDDLIKRLDEALRMEWEAAKKDELNGFDCDSQPIVGPNNSQTATVDAEVGGGGAKIVDAAEKNNTAIVEPIEDGNAGKIPEIMVNDSVKNDNVDSVTISTEVNNSVPAMDPEVGDNELPAGLDSVSVGKDLNVHSSTLAASITVTESVLTEVVVSGQEPPSTETQKDNDSAMKLDNEESKPQPEIEDSKPQQDCDMEPLHEDAIPNSSSAPGNQVSEVNPILGSQLKSDSISSDSVSINEKNELKDNIIADNVKLEQNIVKPEMVEPSSSNFVPGSGESHSMDVGEQHEKKASVEENSSNNVTSPELNKTNSSEDVGYSEKLNLDRSSGDDSMEEDLLESKQFDSKFNVDELRDKKDSSEVNIVKEESGTKVVGDDLSAGKNDTHENNVIRPIAPSEKRKFIDQVSVGSNEPAKRQRRWNSENVKVPGPESASLTPVTTPKDEPAALKRNFSRSDSSATDDAPKERIVPPSQGSPTNSLRIDRFLRPFTLKAVQELLGKTGNVLSFWMDHIKTHCYVTYSSVEEAIKTRDAVYNLQWPPNGGRLLVAEFVDPQEVKVRQEAPPTQAASVSTGSTVPSAPPTSQQEPSPRQHREQPPVPHTLPPPPSLSKAPPAVRERLPSPPPVAEKVEPPIVTLDDLFRKTRATPRIYYLPRSEEQVAAKLAAQGRNRKQ
ncbi:hypothetical protein L6164_025115 [Bauhinia variegata]|uniref:Uncharacterized protein n=1 Tax=Bauhinia variegata TaxID=167791 RepID=A0ACB9LZX2_BAUVA|nr:hypothetical protein L6164_025115 [Bauhinia variegata]